MGATLSLIGRARRALAPRLPLEATATIFIVFVCLVVVAAEGWTIWAERAEHIAQGRATTENLVRSLAQQAEDTFRAADATLIGAVGRLRRDGTGPAAVERLHPYLQEQVNALP